MSVERGSDTSRATRGVRAPAAGIATPAASVPALARVRAAFAASVSALARDGAAFAASAPVLARGLLAAVVATLLVAVLAQAPEAQAGGAPTVQAMVVGSAGQVLAQGTVSAQATTVTAGHRRCAVGAGTPLAVLAALRTLPFSVRDYGHCGSSPARSAELFVYSIDGETNSGQNGWEYKVGTRAGSTGAANQSGPQGNGRGIGSGQQVLWFWCHATAGGCERTLSVAAASAVGRGQRLTVRVNGADNEGRSVPVAGAIVTLGSDFASTGANGTATLIAPGGRGSYALSARKRGLVPSFPETITVR